jgi:predicted NACHT family NTPase
MVPLNVFLNVYNEIHSEKRGSAKEQWREGGINSLVKVKIEAGCRLRHIKADIAKPIACSSKAVQGLNTHAILYTTPFRVFYANDRCVEKPLDTLK